MEEQEKILKKMAKNTKKVSLHDNQRNGIQPNYAILLNVMVVSVIMMSVIVLSVIMLNVIILNSL